MPSAQRQRASARQVRDDAHEVADRLELIDHGVVEPEAREAILDRDHQLEPIEPIGLEVVAEARAVGQAIAGNSKMSGDEVADLAGQVLVHDGFRNRKSGWRRLPIDAQSEHRDQVTNGECDQRDDQNSQLEDGYRDSHDPCSLADTQPKRKTLARRTKVFARWGRGWPPGPHKLPTCRCRSVRQKKIRQVLQLCTVADGSELAAGASATVGAVAAVQSGRTEGFRGRGFALGPAPGHTCLPAPAKTRPKTRFLRRGSPCPCPPS